MTTAPMPTRPRCLPSRVSSDALIERYRHYVPVTVRQICPRVSEEERQDLESTGFVALVQSARRYDPNLPGGGRSASSYLIRAIRWAVLKERAKILEARKEAPQTISLATILHSPTGDDVRLGDVIPDERIDTRPEVVALTQAEIEMLWAAVHQLPQKQRRLILMFYRQDQTYGEIAEAIGKNYSTVLRNMAAGIRMLRQSLA